MTDRPDDLHDVPAPTPAPPGLIEHAWSLDPVVLKSTWIEISDAAETQMTRLAEERPIGGP